jgi:hypothetical protein
LASLPITVLGALAIALAGFEALYQWHKGTDATVDFFHGRV